MYTAYNLSFENIEESKENVICVKILFPQSHILSLQPFALIYSTGSFKQYPYPFF